MKHSHMLLDITEWFKGGSERTPRVAINEIIKLLSERGYRSLEFELSQLIENFLGKPINQCALPDARGKKSIAYRHLRRPEVYTTCLRRDSGFVFLDTESTEPSQEEPAQTVTGRDLRELLLEVDIFAVDDKNAHVIQEAIVDDVMRCFGLTKSKQELKISITSDTHLFRGLRERLIVKPPLSDSLFQRLKESADRDILRELKRRVSVLERDLHELPLPAIKPDRIKSTLDYFSGEEYRLVDRKFAIVCNRTSEIIFLLRDKQDLDNAKHLECPKCSAKIGEETVLSYYESTNSLKELLDGNRWMPLLVRDALVEAGVPEQDIYTEVKHGEDEIDLLVFYQGRVLVMEVKDRPISLNDAYKLSAKTSRLESISEKATRSLDDDYSEVYLSTRRRARANISAFLPIMISTCDIASDARNLLQETKENARFLENCESSLYKFIHTLIDTIYQDELEGRLSELTSITKADSVSNLAAAQLEHAFHLWYLAQTSHSDNTA